MRGVRIAGTAAGTFDQGPRRRRVGPTGTSTRAEAKFLVRRVRTRIAVRLQIKTTEIDSRLGQAKPRLRCEAEPGLFMLQAFAKFSRRRSRCPLPPLASPVHLPVLPFNAWNLPVP